MSLDITIILVLCAFCLCLAAKYWQSRRPASEIKGPLALPVVGSSYVFVGGTRNILKNIVRMVDQYKPICKLWMGHKLSFLLSRPEDVQVVLNKFLEREDGYKYVRPVFGYGLFTRPVKDWREHRKIVVSTLSQKVLNSFVDSFNSYSKILVKKLEKHTKDQSDVFPLLTQGTLDIVCSTIMGTEMKAMDEESPFILWMTKVAELSVIRMFNIFLWPDFIWNLLPISKQTNELDSKIQNFVKKVIETKRKRRGNEERKIFLDHLLALTDKEKWTDDDLTDEARSVIMAASDATAITLSYCLVMLAIHQEIQDKVHEEIFSIFGYDERDVAIEDLSSLQYLDRFIKETLRVFPVTSTIGRQITNDVALGQDILPKNSSVGIPIFHIHRNSEYWPEPLKFDPDRFLPEEVAKRHPCTYLPFSCGPRSCIGYKYATMLMKIVLCQILRNYKVVSTSYQKIQDLKVRMDIATKCVEGYPVKLELRKLL